MSAKAHIYIENNEMTELDHHLHLYDTDANFEADYDGDIYHEPWVSYTIENGEVNYNKRAGFTITYLNRNGDTSATQTVTGQTGRNIEYVVGSAPESWGEHTFLGWSEVEWPTYAQTQQPGFLKTPGATATATGDTTMHAVYSTTFQGLINEGYVNMNVYPETYTNGIANCMFIKPNGYAKELVTDFEEVLDCEAGKLVSTGGTVGEGTYKNAFVFKDTSAHWLTDDEWYDIYNNRQLEHAVASFQFYGLDWSDKESVTVKYKGNNWQVGTSTFGPNSPRVVNVHFTTGQFGYRFTTYGNTGIGCGAEVINFSNAAGTKVSMSRTAQSGNGGLNAAFEGCRNLKEIHNLNLAPVTRWIFAFDGCRSLQTIPASDFATGLTMAGQIVQVFCNNWKLETIEPILNVSAVTDTTAAFYACSALTEVYLQGINAATNVAGNGGTYQQDSAHTWDLHYTQLTQACADYMIANLTPCDPTVDGFVYKGVNFPTGITLTAAQKASLRDNGWIPYINGVEQ